MESVVVTGHQNNHLRPRNPGKGKALNAKTQRRKGERRRGGKRRTLAANELK